MAEGDMHRKIKQRLKDSIQKCYGPLQEGIRYSFEVEPHLLNGLYLPDVLLRDRHRIMTMWEVEDQNSWKALLGGCLAADYAMQVEDAKRRVALHIIIPDERDDIAAIELRLAWARPYFRHLHIKKVMKIKDHEAYMEEISKQEQDRKWQSLEVPDEFDSSPF